MDFNIEFSINKSCEKMGRFAEALEIVRRKVERIEFHKTLRELFYCAKLFIEHEGFRMG
jgi:hypothetical protein